MPNGIVRAFDAVSGKLQWTFSVVPLPGDPNEGSWLNGTNSSGGCNVWSTLSGDENLGLIFIGTGSPSAPPWGGNRLGRNDYSNSIIALGLDGTMRWSFQTGSSSPLLCAVPTNFPSFSAKFIT